jgi:hypothetical protein
VPAPGSQSAPLAGGEQAIATKIKPGLMIINTTLQYTATVVGYDKTGDIALIQLRNASGLTAVQIGNSSSVKTGDSVVALGNAEGRGALTAKPGRVTGLGQTVTASEDGGATASETLRGMIQTNADIVPGDSGGPLASSAGVIGMDTAGSNGNLQQASNGSRSRSTRRCRSPGRSPRVTSAPPSRSATRRSRDSLPAPDRTAAPRRRHTSRAAASAAASGKPRGATPAIPA